MKVDEFQKQESIRRFAMEQLPDMIKERLADLSPESVYARESIKNNGKVLLGITVVPKDRDMAPCIYVERYIPPDPSRFLQEGVWERIADKMAGDFRYALNLMEPEGESLFLPEDIPEKLVLDVVNLEKNRNSIGDQPYREYMDLAILMRWETICGGRTGKIPVTREILEEWGRSYDELYDIALKNTVRKYPGRIAPLEEILNEYSHGLIRDLESPFYYIGNESGLRGVAAILYPGLLRSLYDRIGAPYYVIPSSINELLALPVSFEPDRERLDGLIWEVNTYMLDRSEILSDSLYQYQPDIDQLVIARTSRGL